MKKRFMGMAATALSALMIAPLFAACGQGGDDIDFDENGNVIPSDKTTIINFWGWADKYEEAVFNKLVSNFNEKYSGVIKVNYTPKSSSGYSDNFVVNMIGGPDIAYADERYFKSYADQGVLYDVSEFYKESVKNYLTSEGKNGLDEADKIGRAHV